MRHKSRQSSSIDRTTVQEFSRGDDPDLISKKTLLGNKYDWLVFLGPAIILIAVFFIAPVIIVFIISFTNMSSLTGFSNWSWVGFENWIKIFTHPQSGQHVGVTVIYVSCTLIFFNVGLALVLAILSTHVPRTIGFAFRALWLVPRITPTVVYIMMWRYLFADSPYGILNEIFFRPLGFSTSEMVSAHPYIAIILVNGFIGASFGMIIFTSAIESISKDIMNSSLVDGASIMQRIRYIIIPQIKWPLMFVTTFQTLSLLTSFEQIMLLTDGAYGTEVWSLWAYHKGLNNYFGQFQWGFGMALAGILVIISIVFCILYLKFFKFSDMIQDPKIETL